MSLEREDIEKIARLAHLRLTEAELAEMKEKLSSVLSYIDRLGEADTDGVEPLAHVTGVENVMRDDEVRHCEEDIRTRIIAAFPDSEDGQLKVRSVFE